MDSSTSLVRFTVFPLLPLDNLKCTCPEGAACKSIGAHPAVRWADLEPGEQLPPVAKGGGRGLATGAKSGVFVLDVDMKNGKDGLATLAKLGPLPPTYTVATPSGGKHFYFSHPGWRVKNSGGALGKDLGGGLDIRGDGGYVVMPGSPHRNGGTYAVELDVPIAPAPAWLLAWPGLRDTPREANVTGGPTPIGPAHKEWARRAALALEACKTFEPSRGDGGASAALGGVVRRLVWDLELPADLVADLIEEHFNARCTRSDGTPWPWEREEIERFIQNSRAHRDYAQGIAPEGWDLGEKVRRGTLDKALKKAALLAPGTFDRDRLDSELASEGTERCTDTGNVSLFVRFHGSRVRYVDDWAKWLVWDGRRWAPSSEVAVLALTGDVSNARFAWLGVSYTDADPQEEESTAKRAKWATYTANLKGRESIVKLTRAHPRIRIRHETLDVDPFLFNVANGTLDLRTGELRPHNPEDLLTKLSSIAYDPAAKCPTWEAFLAKILPDELTREYLHRAAGYSLTGNVKEQVLFFLQGDGSNGKSTFMLLLQTLSGEYGQQAPQDFLIARRGDAAHPADIADLCGVRLSLCPEIDQGEAGRKPVSRRSPEATRSAPDTCARTFGSSPRRTSFGCARTTNPR